MENDARGVPGHLVRTVDKLPGATYAEDADDCSYIWHIPSGDRCKWVKETKDCITDSVIQYTELLFCSFASENTFLFGIGLLMMIIWLLYLFLILGTTSDNFTELEYGYKQLQSVTLWLAYIGVAMIIPNIRCNGPKAMAHSQVRRVEKSSNMGSQWLSNFCPSLAVIADVLRLSDNIAGVTILAFGNGAPDIFTSLVSGSDEGIIMFTELIGAGVFVTAIIAGSVAVIKPFRVQLKPLMRDAGFYIVTVCWISYVVRDYTVHLWEAISFVLYYLLFISVVVIMQIYENREERLKSRIPGVPDPDILRTYLANKDVATVPNIPVRTRASGLRTKLVELEKQEHNKMAPGEAVEENGDRPKGLFKEFLYDINPVGKEDWIDANRIFKFILIIRAPAMIFLQLFIPLVNTTAVKRGWSKLLNCFQLCVTPTVALFLLNVWKAHFGPVSVVPIFLLVGSVIGVIVFLMTHVDRVPKFHNVFAFLGFLAAMLMVYLIAGEVMAVLQCVGYAFSISDAMLGITFLAWGNSVGDLISNVAIARRGFPRMGYAACFGGPMFNTLLGLGLTYGKEASKLPQKRTVMRMSDMAPGCLAFLLCSLISTIIYLNITGSIARKSYAYLLYSIYFTFILIQFLSEFKLIHPLGTDHRPD
ncbi:Sodium/potassium/calcium exchanger 6 [Eufriesea mexicana]|uniref:Sodium/potassium/calcium exchanger 6 n=1 Tax=Eufriesea mexicana TaxID=516756 RepID=A0A310STC1_9HYME|nr:Sodium/potassium/calcium exchanger 6 [Eufriesea mexicana]